MNSKGHLIISIIKSGLRIFGCISFLISKSPDGFLTLMLLAELLGVLEELVDNR